jgi:hypothetical protein
MLLRLSLQFVYVLSSNQLARLPDVVHQWSSIERLYFDDNRD